MVVFVQKGHVTFDAGGVFFGGLIIGSCIFVVPNISRGFMQENVEGREKFPAIMHGVGLERTDCMLEIHKLTSVDACIALVNVESEDKHSEVN